MTERTNVMIDSVYTTLTIFSIIYSDLHTVIIPMDTTIITKIVPLSLVNLITAAAHHAIKVVTQALTTTNVAVRDWKDLLSDIIVGMNLKGAPAGVGRLGVIPLPIVVIITPTNIKELSYLTNDMSSQD